MTDDRLWELPPFENLTDDEIDWLRAHSSVIALQTGDYFFREGQPAEHFYVVLAGELQITRTINGRQVVMGTTPRGVIGGELALLNMIDSPMTARAILPTRLLVMNVAAFRQVFSACPPLAIYILRTAAERMAGTVMMTTQDEKMAALGKFSAGLAHELNNPASAATRAAASLNELLPTLVMQTLNLCTQDLPEALIHELIVAQKDAMRNASTAPILSPVEQSDREEALLVWLEDRDVQRAWEVAPALVMAGIGTSELEALTAGVPEAALSPTLGWLCTTLTAARLLDDVGQSAGRIADLVKAIKDYTFMDQGDVQEVDLHKGIDNTLRILRHKLKHVEVLREYDPSIPHLMARGSELNQVWTNLIDNAVDAMAGAGTLKLITRLENTYAMVEIADTGPGIPPEIESRVFEPFFTTKGVGEGTGLGLDIVYRIIQRHNGTIEFWSQPGSTRFIVRLPLGHEEAI